MFGSNPPFGQPPTSPFGSQPVFGQSNNGNNNPFASKPFGSPSPFGTQTGSSMFGGTSTGVFGAPQSSSPFSSTTAFGASSSSAFGNSTPAFGATSTPAFGSSSSSSFGGSVFGQKPAFGGFGSTPTQTSPFGSTTQQSQPAFGSSIFGSSTPFGATSNPSFGATSAPAFGVTSTPAFGATSTPSFGATSTPAFGASSSTSAFGSTASPAFGSTGTAFGVSSAPVFGSGGAFGASSTPAFGTSSTPTFGASGSAFGAPSTPSFSFGSAPAFGQSTSAFGSSPFGSAPSPSPFGTQSSAFGTQSTTTFPSSGFGQSAFGAPRGGSRVAPFTPTTEADSGSGTQPAGKLESISAMPIYKDKSHEELRWEDYQLGDKGGPPNTAQQTSPSGFGVLNAQTNPFASSSTFPQTSANTFSSPTPSNPFAPKTPGFANSTFPNPSSALSSVPFAVPSSNPFGTTPSTGPSIFPSTPNTAFGPAGSLFNPSTSSSLFGTSPSLFSATAQSATSSFNTGLNMNSSQTSPLFNSSVSSLGQSTSAFGQHTLPQSSMFNASSTGFGNMFSNNSSLIPSSTPLNFAQTTPSVSTQFQVPQVAQSSAFSFSNFNQPQAGDLANAPSMLGQSNFGQLSATQNSAVVQPVVVTNPFGTLPAMPQMSIGRAGNAPSIQYGISSMPVVDKPAPARISSLLTSRHLSQRRARLPARKYNPKNDGPKIPFFGDDEETPSTPKADALFIPRENPRALVIRPMEQLPLRTSAEKASPLKDASITLHENGKINEDGSNVKDDNKNSVENGIVKERAHFAKVNQKANGVHDDHSGQKEDSYGTLNGHRAGEAAIAYEHGADIEALMPKLRRRDYFTEPRIQELAAKERAEPGFCCRVKDFVVGRHGYGSIKFLGETDVRRLDLESLVQFNNREVIVYMDDSKKPPVGQGLNKAAEVTLLNIKCFDKKTGRQYTEGPKIDKYKEMLKRKAEDQGAEFVSYDAIKGEWKFRVNHFSMYKLGDEEEDDGWVICASPDC
ncbi:Nucleoporin2 domain-containing protein [Cephalotus follicularis]|uniref:Nucleoporin autopeptidase n=1 Tax=Cephalotus follicularis TaxID=3775 RepID=A0A1Q3C4C0_CEPFO|nr:Nucleoporin2 domain-containing protein [Cephalotus follicularis]